MVTLTDRLYILKCASTMNTFLPRDSEKLDVLIIEVSPDLIRGRIMANLKPQTSRFQRSVGY